MGILLKNGMVYENGSFISKDIFFDGVSAPTAEFDISNMFVVPGFVDVHVHLRQPGFSYKETVESGTMAAARGGYTAVCSMPNLDPAPDSAATLRVQQDLIDKQALIAVFPYGCITKGRMGKELADFDGLLSRVCAFTDDGSGIQTESLMREAMQKAAKCDAIIAAHCEDNALLFGGYIHDGEYARAHGHRGICSESEYGQIARDLKLCEETGCRYHVCHISTKESVMLIREAKARGVRVTCETAPHYLVLCDGDLQEDGRFKMNPPLRSEEDRKALIEGICDGTIDMIATDHAPHSAEEKSRGLAGSSMGIVGLETAFSVLYTHLVKKGIISLEKLVELMSINPRRIFGLASDEGAAVLDLNKEYVINSANFLSMGKSTPFENMPVCGEVAMTVYGGKTVWLR